MNWRVGGCGGGWVGRRAGRGYSRQGTLIHCPCSLISKPNQPQCQHFGYVRSFLFHINPDSTAEPRPARQGLQRYGLAACVAVPANQARAARSAKAGMAVLLTCLSMQARSNRQTLHGSGWQLGCVPFVQIRSTSSDQIHKLSKVRDRS